jgi:hypothetical protein
MCETTGCRSIAISWELEMVRYLMKGESAKLANGNGQLKSHFCGGTQINTKKQLKQ